MQLASRSDQGPIVYTSHILSNDGVRLIFDRFGSDTGASPLVLVHGWSGSRHYFCRNAQALAQDGSCCVYALDLRCHGDSGHYNWGHHVSRLAADLRDFLEQLDLKDATLLGTSMGCAVIWSYIELFGQQRLAGAVFVDQAPLQNRAADWSLGSQGCYDAASLARLQAALLQDMGAFADSNAECCLSLPLSQDVLQLLRAETLRCDPRALGALMADHTQLDWRPLLARVRVPCLVVAGARSGVFPLEGCLAVSDMVPDCCSVVFQRANHWLYLEQPDEFNSLVLDFVKRRNAGRAALALVS